MRKIDRRGQRFGRLLVIEEAGPSVRGGRLRANWLCACDCGGSKVVCTDDLAYGSTSSCGCLDRESRIARNKARAQRVKPLISNDDGTFTVTLTQGKCAIIDAADAVEIGQHNWHAVVDLHKSTTYAVRTVCGDDGCQRRVWMHRVITSAPEDMHVDHKNGDGLDNRRRNLRLATREQNGMNRLAPKNNRSGRVGVYPHNGRWRAHISVNGKVVHLGEFDTIAEASAVREAAENKHYGEWSGHSSRQAGSG